MTLYKKDQFGTCLRVGKQSDDDDARENQCETIYKHGHKNLLIRCGRRDAGDASGRRRRTATRDADDADADDARDDDARSNDGASSDDATRERKRR